MPVISDGEPIGYGTYTPKNFANTTRNDCQRGNANAWDAVNDTNDRVQKLRDEAAAWLALEDAMEAYGVETAGELPKAVYDVHRRKLETPIYIT